MDLRPGLITIRELLRGIFRVRHSVVAKGHGQPPLASVVREHQKVSKMGAGCQKSSIHHCSGHKISSLRHCLGNGFSPFMPAIVIIAVNGEIGNRSTLRVNFAVCPATCLSTDVESS